MSNINVMIAKNTVKGHEDMQLVVFPQDDIAAIKSRRVEAYLHEAALFAKRNKVHLVPGLYIKNGYLCLCIINDNGEIMYEQKSTHLNTAVFSELKRGDEIEAVETPFGNVFLCVDVDIYKPEILRIAALKGADIAVSCQYIKGEHYSTQMILSGAWQQAQQNCMYIISSTNVQSSIIGPCRTATDLSGFIQGPSSSYPLIGELSTYKRDIAHDEFPIFHSLNHELYNKHMGELCK